MNEEFPQPSKSDHAHAAARGILGAIPLGGTAAIEIFNNVIAPPIQKRRDEWLNSLAKRLTQLEKDSRDFDLSSLQENDEFTSTLLTASQAAIKTHSQEKLEALRNAVMNTAIKKEHQESILDVFLLFIDQFSPLHLSLLKCFDENFVWKSLNGKKPETGVPTNFLTACVGSYETFADLDRSLLGVCIKDLMVNKLIRYLEIIDIVELNSNNSFLCYAGWKTSEESVGPSKLLVKHGPAIKVDAEPGSLITTTTHLGQRFVDFIKNPNES